MDHSSNHSGQKHPFHIVAPSPWPMLTAFAAGLMAFGLVCYMHDTKFGSFVVGSKGLILGLVAVLACMFVWWRDAIHEGVVEKAHSPVAKIGFRYGMLLFIASEVMFFVAFFWAFFWAKFYPGIGIDHVFPPKTIAAIDPFELPFLMTLILLLSGCTVTWAHHAFMTGDLKEAKQGLWCTVGLGVLFSCIQFYEYAHAEFHINDTIFGSVFYMATGFHGLHVIIGTIFLAVCLYRTYKGHFTAKDHFGFEAAAWYWHFVDVVWLFLFVAIYWYGGHPTVVIPG